MGKWIMTALAIMLTGCATSPIPAEQAAPVPEKRLLGYQSPPDGEFGELIVTRDTGFTGGACTTVIFIDAGLAAEMRAGETARFAVPAGSLILGANTKEGICGGGLKEREVVINAGEVKRYRVSTDTSMSMDLSPTAF